MMLAIETIKVTETVGRLVFLIYSVSIFYSVALTHTLSKLERLDCIQNHFTFPILPLPLLFDKYKRSFISIIGAYKILVS